MDKVFKWCDRVSEKYHTLLLVLVIVIILGIGAMVVHRMMTNPPPTMTLENKIELIMMFTIYNFLVNLFKR